MPPGIHRTLLAAAAVAVALAGCGDDDSERVVRVTPDPPVKPPAGWRTVRNERAAFTVAAPRDWRARQQGAATLIRSPDRLTAITVTVDTGEAGRHLAPGDYARAGLEFLPDFEGSLKPQVRRIHGSPYPSARVDGSGTLGTSPRTQLITVAAFRPRGGPIYAIFGFRNARATRARNERVLSRVLRTFRVGA
jgi:hypothetical protein